MRVRVSWCWALSLVLLAGCRSTVEVNEHRAVNANPSVTVKPYWEDPLGIKRLVGGIPCELRREGEPRALATGVTNFEVPFVFQDVEPGRYDVYARDPTGVIEVRQAVEIRPGHRVTVRIDVSGVIEEETTPTALIGRGVAFATGDAASSAWRIGVRGMSSLLE